MAVYKRGYTRYQGTFTGRWARLMVLPRFAWRDLLGQRLIVILLVVSMFFPVGSIAYVYLVNNPVLLLGLGNQGAIADTFKIDSQFFLIFMNVQSVIAILLAAFAGPSLVAPDLTNGALPLYFSRPLSRGDYIVARLMVLVGILSPVTWIPGLIVFGMQSGLAGWSWFADNWNLGVGVLLGLVLWILLVSLVAMASSAYVKWRVVAGALVLAVFFLLTGASALLNAVLRVEWGYLFNPAYAMEQVWTFILNAEPLSGPSALACAIGLIGMGALLLGILWRRLRPVEVIS
jgi:ABC-2 type transport system permease protein